MSARVLVIGLDSVDKDIVLRMSAAGRLPTLARLLAEGAHAETVNPIALYVGALWTSFSTGTSPARHGRHSPRQLVPGTYEAPPLHPHEIRRPPFWAALADAGHRTAIVDVPHSRVIAGAGGVQIVEWGSHDPACGFTTWPPALADMIASRFGGHPVHAEVERDCDLPLRTAEDYARFRDALLDGIARKADLNAFVLAEDDWDLMLTVFCEGHCSNHQCWHLRDPSHPRHDPAVAAAVGDVIETVYEALDGAVARLLRDAGDATVFVLASHGAGPHYEGSFLLDRILRRLERPLLPAHRRWRRDAFAWWWEHLSDDRRKRHARFYDRLWRGYEGLPPLDPSTRRWFKVHNNEPWGAIRVNVVGREPHGIVHPGPELEACCAELCRDLLALVNVETGQPLVQRVLRTADVYQGENLDMLPDLLIDWNRSAPVRVVRSEKIGTLTAEYEDVRTGDHRPSGLLLACGPDIAPGRLAPIDVTDLAPTIAARLGVTLADVDGRPVAALCGP